MKTYFGSGMYIEPDKEPRTGQHHKRIIRARSIPDTQSGYWLDLECGHRAMAFGDLHHLGGVALCTQCRDREEGEA